MGNRKRVGVDVDGVLADLLTPMLKVLSEMREEHVTIDMLPGHELDELIPKEHKRRDGTVVDGKSAFWSRVGKLSCRHLNIYPGAQEGIQKLQEVADVYIVTSHLRSGQRWVYDRDEWLHEHFKIPHAKIIHTAAKYTFYGAMLIDDKPQNVERWFEEHPLGIPVLWAQPYNNQAKYANNHDIVRTRSWDDVVKLLQTQYVEG